MVTKASLTTVVIPQPFAKEGNKNTIPVSDDGTNAASWQLGFPPKTSIPYDEGGLPPDRLDFNGVINSTTNAEYNIQLGVAPTFSQAVSNAIGGYPEGSILSYDDGTHSVVYVQSLIDNNTYNFVTTPSYIDDGTHWQTVTPTKTWVQNYVNTKVNDTIMRAPNWSSMASFSSGTTTTNNGWLKVRHLEYVNANVYINSVLAYNHQWSGGDFGSQWQVSYIPVAKGDAITYSGMESVYFVPSKAA